MTREVGMPLKNSKGELIKCDCGGRYTVIVYMNYMELKGTILPTI